MSSFPRAPLSVATDEPLSVDGVVFCDEQRRITCCVAIKLTYRLLPDECALETRPLPIYFEEQLQESSVVAKGVARPSDVDVMKTAPEFVVVGSAYASNGPVDHLLCRVAVGDVEKSIETWVQRRYRADGTLEAKGTATRFPLDFGVSAGGPGTDNPLGVNTDRIDSKGRRRVPQLLPAGFALQGPGAFVPIAGLAPLDVHSPIRTRYLGDEDMRWLADPANRPRPDDLDGRFFQASLSDQWLPRPISGSEWIVLDNMHPRHPRLTTRLPGIEPRVFAYGKPMPVTADQLMIDTDLGIATLTWRGFCDLDPTAQRSGVPIVVQSVRSTAAAPPPREAPPPMFPEPTRKPPPPPKRNQLVRPPIAPDAGFERTAMDLPAGKQLDIAGPMSQALPFSSAVPPPRASVRGGFDGALPFGRSTPGREGPSDPITHDLPGGAPASKPSSAGQGAKVGVSTSTITDMPALGSAGMPTPPAPAPAPAMVPPAKPSPPLVAPPVAVAPVSAPPVAGMSAQPLGATPLGGSPSAAAPPAAPAPVSVPPPAPAPVSVSAPPPPPAVVQPPAMAPMSASLSGPPSVAPSSLSSLSSLSPMPSLSSSISAPAIVTSPSSSSSPMMSLSSSSGLKPPSGQLSSAPSHASPLSTGSSPPAPAMIKPQPKEDDGAFGAAFGPAVRSASLLSAKQDAGIAKNASDAAAERERAKDGPVRFKPASADEPSEGPRRRYQIDLLTFEPSIVRRLRLQSPFQELLKAAVFQRRASLGKDGVEEDRDRRDVLRVLSYERPLDLSEARRLVESRWDSDDLEPPLLLIAGEARPSFDEIETLRTTAAITGPLGPTDKRIQGSVTLANEALASNPPPTAEKCQSLTRQLEQAATALSLPAKFVQTQVERTLLENRKFKRRQLWGTERFRIELSTAGAEALPVYIDDAASGHWPLLPAIPVVLIGELRPREDAAESSPEAFLVRALGRVLAARANM